MICVCVCVGEWEGETWLLICSGFISHILSTVLNKTVIPAVRLQGCHRQVLVEPRLDMFYVVLNKRGRIIPSQAGVKKKIITEFWVTSIIYKCRNKKIMTEEHLKVPRHIGDVYHCGLWIIPAVTPSNSKPFYTVTSIRMNENCVYVWFLWWKCMLTLSVHMLIHALQKYNNQKCVTISFT